MTHISRADSYTVVMRFMRFSFYFCRFIFDYLISIDICLSGCIHFVLNLKAFFQFGFNESKSSAIRQQMLLIQFTEKTDKANHRLWGDKKKWHKTFIELKKTCKNIYTIKHSDAAEKWRLGHSNLPISMSFGSNSTSHRSCYINKINWKEQQQQKCREIDVNRLKTTYTM